MGRRHSWDAQDRCRDCGLRRSGYQGGRTGSLSYYDRYGEFVGHTAGPCVAPIPQRGDGSPKEGA